MLRTTIVPTVQTKANQNTDLYVPIGAGGAAVIPGNLTVNGDVVVNGTNVDLSGAAVVADTVDVIGNMSVGGTSVDLSGATVIANVIGSATATITDTLNVGDPTDVGGGGLFIRGTSGNGTVYDTVYNRPGPVDYTQSFTGVVLGGLANPIVTGAYQSGSTFTPTRTGMYLLEGVIGASGSTWTAALGDKIQLVLVPTPAVPGVFPASCGVIMMSSGTGFTSWTSMSCDKLVAGVTYTITADVENNSTTLANNNDEITFDFYITQLC
jgi:hypothetical protein